MKWNGMEWGGHRCKGPQGMEVVHCVGGKLRHRSPNHAVAPTPGAAPIQRSSPAAPAASPKQCSSPKHRVSTNPTCCPPGIALPAAPARRTVSLVPPPPRLSTTR
jgi:hypothetical protein